MSVKVGYEVSEILLIRRKTPNKLLGTTFTIPDSTGDPVSMESEIGRDVYLSKTERSEITRLKIRSSGPEYLNCFPDNKNVSLSKMKALSDDNSNMAAMLELVFDFVRSLPHNHDFECLCIRSFLKTS